DVFPQGLPDEYAFVATFKFRKASRREDWYIWQIIDKYGIPQVSIRLDGENKAVEYNAVGLRKDAVRTVFKNREVSGLFDRNWHKMALSIQTSSVSLYIDCKLIETLPMEERENINIRGKTVIGKRLYDSVPIDFDLQRIVIYCDAKDTELESCCDLPSNPCQITLATQVPQVEISTTPQPPAEVDSSKTINCSCHQGEKGDLGLPGFQGPRGPKGDTGAYGPKGEKGESKDGTELGQFRWDIFKFTLMMALEEALLITFFIFQGRISDTSQGKGEKGDQGYPGEQGFKGVAGTPGVKGERGQKGFGGDKGVRGFDGFPGKIGLPGEVGATGSPGASGVKGEKVEFGGLKGEPGQLGPRGLPGLTGPPGPMGRPGLDGNAGKPGLQGQR
ncbi:hypothetical protein scyTo_0015291, partial [Scyliorhinus torazame]|nr:hypothetical protein [Scyliorhinus torazame]